MNIASRIQKPSERAAAIRKIARAGLFDAAWDMIASSRPEDRARQRISIGRMKVNEAKRGLIFEAARKELEFIPGGQEWVSAATDLISIAPFPEHQKSADEIVVSILERLERGSDRQWADRSLPDLAEECSRFKDVSEVSKIIDRIVSRNERASAWLRSASNYLERGQSDVANDLWQRAWATFEPAPGRRLPSTDRDRLFLLVSKLKGTGEAERLANEIYRIDRTAGRSEEFQQGWERKAVGKVLAAEAAHSQSWGDAVSILERAGFLGRELGEALYYLVREIDGAMVETIRPLPLLNYAIAQLTPDASVLRESIAEQLARLGSVERAVELIKGEGDCSWRSGSYGSIAKVMQRTTQPDQIQIANVLGLAAEAAAECQARRQRADAFPALALTTARLGMSTQAHALSEAAESALFESSVFDERVSAAFQRVAIVDANGLDRSAKTELVRALLSFAEGYYEVGRISETQQALSHLTPIANATPYRSDVERLQRKVRGKTYSRLICVR